MSDFIQETPAALKWVEEAELRHEAGRFGKIVHAVIWTDERGPDGQLLVAVDPNILVAQIDANPFILLHNHDPGCPKGKLLEGACFENADGRRFIAAVIGYYEGGDVLSFRDLGLDVGASVPTPERLPMLSDDVWIEIATDSREVDEEWLNQVTNDPPVRIKRTELSHNSEESFLELIRIGAPYVFFVWNPFVKAIATEAGKDFYAGVNAWLRKLLRRMADRRSPVLDFHSHQDGCQISFLFRGKEEKKLLEALDALSGAAAQGAQIVSKLKAQGKISRQMVYEFDNEALLWSPSFVILTDDRIITDNLALIAIGNLPTGLSLGLTRSDLL